MLSLRAVALFLVPSVALAGATASSFRPEHRKGANLYNAQSAVDGDVNTCWMVPGESPNRGEWILLDIPKGTIDKIGMNVGWSKDKESYDDYARIKKVKIEVYNFDDEQQPIPGPTGFAEFADKYDFQVVDINPDLDIGRELFGGKVKISVVDIYEGRDFPNLAVSEVLLYLKEFETEIKAVSGSPENAGHGIDMLQDANVKTFWTGPATGASFTFSSSGFGVASFAITNGPKDFSRAKSVKVTANNRSVTQDLADVTTPQSIQVPSLNGYTGGAFGDIQVEILATYPGTKDPSVAIAELKAMASNYEGF